MLTILLTHQFTARKSDFLARDAKSHHAKKMDPTDSYFSQELMGKMCGQCKRNLVLSETGQIGFLVNDASSGSIPDINHLPNHHCMKHLFSARLAQPN